jgi:hypothetical protein
MGAALHRIGWPLIGGAGVGFAADLDGATGGDAVLWIGSEQNWCDAGTTE